MKLVSVDFKKDTIETILYENIEYVSIRKICENLGIDRASQVSKVKSEEAYQTKVINIQTSQGNRDTLCIPLDKLNGWLFSISSHKVKPEVRKKLIEYKNEAFKVLHDYFNKGYAIKPEVKAELERIIEDKNHLVMTQNTTIANLQKQLESKPKQIEEKPKKHPMSYLSPVEHNTFLELVFQMIEQKRDISNFKKVLTKRENNMQNFLNSFENRYPEVKSYIEKYN